MSVMVFKHATTMLSSPGTFRTGVSTSAAKGPVGFRVRYQPLTASLRITPLTSRSGCCTFVLDYGLNAMTSSEPTLPVEALRLSLLGDGPGVLAFYVANAGTPEGDRCLSVFRERFVTTSEHSSPEVTDPYIRLLIRVYRQYYRIAFMRVLPQDKAEDWLKAQILDASPELTPDLAFEDVEFRVRAAIELRGHHAMLGLVAPFRALHIWTKEEWRRFPVDLPHKSLELEVCLADGFLELGWFHFVTFGVKFSGGWTSADDSASRRFWRVRQTYDNTDPNRFRLFLLHEAQHVADLADFPGIPEPDLEYRAKLVELASTESPEERLQKFRQEAAPEPQSPHAFASWMLLSRLSAALSTNERAFLSPSSPEVDPVRIRRTATDLFWEDHSHRTSSTSRDSRVSQGK